MTVIRIKNSCRKSNLAAAVVEFFETETGVGLFHGHPVFDQLDNRLVYRCLSLFECGNKRLIVEEDRLQRIVYCTEIEQRLEVDVGTVSRMFRTSTDLGSRESFSL